MSIESSSVLEKTWLKNLPHARVAYPASFPNRLKYLFWRLYTPYHSLVRDAALGLRLVRHQGRQAYLLGTIAPNLTLKEFISSLVAKGFGNHFIAWKDEGEVVSLRRADGFDRQYHLRVFADREVRAHYEYTAECYPFRHLKAVDQEPRREEFLVLLGETIVPSPRE